MKKKTLREQIHKILVSYYGKMNDITGIATSEVIEAIKKDMPNKVLDGEGGCYECGWSMWNDAIDAILEVLV